MVEYPMRVDNIFSALADPIRRDILERTTDAELTVNQIALDYDISLAAVSKHLKVLLEADLIRKRKAGRYNYVTTKPEAMREAAEYFGQFEIVQVVPMDSSREGIVS